MADDRYKIQDEATLEHLVGKPFDFLIEKVAPRLNEPMQAFIEASSLAIVSTIDSNGRADVSPKGDSPGFVQVNEEGNLLIPERVGNRLTFGFRNILRNGSIGLIFLAPHQRETLRIKGTATLHTDPDVLEAMTVKGRPALLYTRVEVQECFFHCGKALIRSHLWEPDRWPKKRPSIVSAHRLLGKEARDEEEARKTDAALERSYAEDLY